ncbi:MAG: phosphotransferase [Bacteroidales bacterium]|nr:phosphotransferase [Bacteroidales bacterium]
MDVLESLFLSYTSQACARRVPLSAGGSRRRYFRLSAEQGPSYIGVIGTDKDENAAFTAISAHFKKQGLPVPEVYACSEDGLAYLQEDLGDDILYNAVAEGRRKGEYSPEERRLLASAVALLPDIQFRGAQALDFGVCYPQSQFDGRNIDFDLNYFKYCFLKESSVEFNEIRLQDDFDRFKADLLACGGAGTFMFRDFQARNVMLRDGKPYFIDFQGGRKGPIYYDVASFLWQASSRFSQSVREELLGVYLQNLSRYASVDEEDFRSKLRLFVLFRCLQVLGAYGFRGLIERKEYFVQSIPAALDNLRGLGDFPQYPYLDWVIKELCKPQEKPLHDDLLHIDIISFSYKKGLPQDKSGNGGGYIFDCRAVHNPGKYARFAHSTGKDADVIEFLEQDGEVLVFLDSVYKLADAHVQRFLERGFTHLQFCFGCTGGQHRSVYCACALEKHLKEKFPQTVVHTVHREMR